MNQPKYLLKDGTLYLYPFNRIDSSNAPELEAAFDAFRAENPSKSVILDLDETEYVSSAGLRVFLRLRKSVPDLKIINASSEVYEILEMTGFTELIPVEKAFRKVSVEGCEVIGRGANGVVYRLDPDTIIKVYLYPDALADIRREQALARRAFVLGIPTAISYDVVRVGEGYGSVFELLNAQSIAKLILKDPENVDKYVKMCVDLLKQLHSTEVKPEDMPDMKAVAVDWARFLSDYLPAEAADRLVALIEAVPDDLHMLHGDYHIKNVMVQNGECLLIDMDTLCHGHPVFEFASIFNAYVGFSAVDHKVVESFLGIPYELSSKIWKKHLHMYLGTEDPAVVDAVEKKAMLIGYTRLLRRTIRRSGLETEEGRALIDFYKGQILNLLESVDTLVF